MNEQNTNTLAVGSESLQTPVAQAPSAAGLAAQETQSARAQLGKLKEAEQQYSVMRENIDSLLKLRDTVTQEDVVKAAGNIVSAGIPAGEMAGVLSTMPKQGDQLEQWLQSHSRALAEREKQVVFLKKALGHQLATLAFRQLTAHGLEQQQAAMRKQAGGALAPQVENQNGV
jgi:hypothetical protein